jgi:hypothetical protein
MMTGGQNDYSACTTWLTHKNDAYLLHVYRGRLEYPELRRKVIGLATEHSATTVLIENAGPGMNLLQDLRAAMPQGMRRPIGVKPEGSSECTPLRTCLSGTTVPPVRPASPGRLGRVALQQFVKVSGPSPSFGRIGLDGYESAYPNGPGPLQ